MSAAVSAAQIFEQQLLEARILRRVNAAANEEPRRVLEVLCSEIARALYADSAAFGRLNSKGDALEIIAEYRQHSSSALGVVLPLSGNKITAFVIQERCAVVIEDAQNDPQFGASRQTAKNFGIKSMMIVPIMTDEAVLGTLGVDSFTPRNFSISDQQLAMNVVQAAIPALKQTHIIEALREQLFEREQAEQALRQSQERFLKLVNNLECIVSEGEIIGQEVTLGFVSQYAETIIGYPVQQWYQDPNWFETAIYHQDLDIVREKLAQAMQNLTPIDIEYRVKHNNGTLVWLRNQFSFETLQNRVYWRSLATDISHLKRQQQLEQDRSRVLEMIAQGAALTDTLQTIVGLLYRQFGLPISISSYQAASTQLLAQVGIPSRAIELMKSIQFGENATAMRRSLKNGSVYTFKIAQSKIFPEALCQELLAAGLDHATLLPMHLESGQVRGGLVFFSKQEFLEAQDPRIRSGCDLAAIAIERQRLLSSLEHQALHDPLTGLANRTLYNAHLENAIATATHNQSSFALVQLDLNFFKSLNDTHGHAYGDKVLCQVAEVLQQSIRASDLVARLGGDEFCVVALEIKNHQDAAHFCHKLEQALTLLHLEPPEVISAAIGYALFPTDAAQADTLYSHADRAMYQKKNLARQRRARV